MNVNMKILGAAAGLWFSAGVVADDGAFTLQSGFDAARNGYYSDAASLFVPLANSGDAHAQFNLALMYHSGLGVGRDENEAVKWYLKAAESGSDMARTYLAVGYGEGWFGLQQDATKARYWQDRLTKE